MSDLKYIQLIEDYVQGKLTEEQSENFLNRLIQDEELYSQYKSYEAALLFCEHLKYVYLKSFIMDLLNEDAPPKFNRKIPHLLKIAAIFVFLLAGTFLFYANLEYCNKCIIEKPKLDFLLSMHRCPNPEIDTTYYSVLVAYNEGKYGQMISFLESNKIDGLSSEEQILTLAAGYHLNNNIKQSEKHLSSNFKNNYLDQFADWLQLRNALIEEKPNKTQRILQKMIKDTSHSFNEEAKVIEIKLNHPLRKLVF